MSDKPLYLKQNVVMEPLINQWYAWPMLVAPHTYAMIMANWHMKIMESYIKSPRMHANAVKNPKMIGGPFIDLPGDQSGLVKELMNRTLTENDDLVEIAAAIKELDTLLTNEARGNSLLSFYPRIPEMLQGFVELGYDLNNNPSVRYIERMFYNSAFYKRAREKQSIQLTMVDADHRAFALSTPRFPDATHLNYNIPFDSDVWDRLFKMREAPAPLSNIAELIPEDPEERAYFESFFTEETPQAKGRDRQTIDGKGIRVKYFGHATLLIESPNCSIMTDPVVSYKISDTTVSRYTYEDLPEVIDYVVLTHNHQDHILFETLIPLRHKIKNIIVPKSNGGTLQDPSIKLVLESTGFKNVIEMEELESIDVPDGQITGLPFFGEHGELHIRSKLAYHVKLNGKAVVCAADSNNLSPRMYDMIREMFGSIDRIFIGMECAGAPMSWLYGPLLTKPLERRQDQERRLDGSDCEKGLKMIASLDSKYAYVYAMGQEPWLTFISSIKYTEKSKPIVESNALIAACQEKGIHAERLYGCKALAW
ncbi:MAG: MBL fold metallo-hydrolase [Acidobacteriota bacterium]|nr:MBL fold metallo-hydrolase [Acidobacteriota bacterium]